MRMRKFYFILTCWVLCSGAAFAKDISIGGIANTLFDGADILAKLMWAACILVGIALFLTAFTQFQIHRDNPKLVPLTTPITYIILALIAICIPFGSKITGFLDGYINKDSEPPSRGYIQKQSFLDLDK